MFSNLTKSANYSFWEGYSRQGEAKGSKGDLQSYSGGMEVYLYECMLVIYYEWRPKGPLRIMLGESVTS